MNYRKRNWDDGIKQRIVNDYFSRTGTVKEIASKYGVCSQTVYYNVGKTSSNKQTGGAFKGAKNVKAILADSNGEEIPEKNTAANLVFTKEQFLAYREKKKSQVTINNR